MATIGEIYLYDKDCNHIASAKIDSEDVEKCKLYKWCLDGHDYVVSGNGSSKVYLHKFVMGVDSSFMLDHIYGDKLDNRKSQLRECNKAQNIQNQKLHINNTSGEKNVCWSKQNGKWRVEIAAFNKKYFLGLFIDYDQACQVARTERRRLHKEFTRDDE